MGAINTLDERQVNQSLRRRFYLFRKNLKGLAQLASLRLGGAYKSPVSVSFCTTVKDRFEHLEKTFLRNIEDNAAYPLCDFVLLNYNCPDPRTEKWARTALAPHIESGKVKYYFFPDVPKYHFAHSQNLAIRLAKGKIVCNIAADNFIGAGFAAYCSAMLGRGGTFIRGPVDGRGLGGKICMLRDDWERVGGYDERMADWGGDDTDITNRLQMIGLKWKTILPERYCGILAHSDELRTRHLGMGKEESQKYQRSLAHENMKRGIVRPNVGEFGKGRVLRNFTDWIEV